MNKQIIGAIAVLTFLVGCGGQEENKEEDIATQVNEGAKMYDCEGEKIKTDFNNDVEPNTIIIYIAGEEMTLSNVETTSGSKYSDGDVAFSIQPGEAIISMEETGQSLNCVEVVDADTTTAEELE